MILRKVTICSKELILYYSMCELLVEEKIDVSQKGLTEVIDDLPFIEEVYPYNASCIKIFKNNTIEFEGHTYIKIDLESKANVYLLKEALGEPVYIIYRERKDARYYSDGKIYRREDEAVYDLK